MKLNQRTIEVKSMPGIHEALVNILRRKDGPQLIIETGTYLGTGTTQRVIGAVLEVFSKSKPSFYTIEANPENWIKACGNLSEHRWITLVNGFSVSIEEAKKWIQEDPMLRESERYPEVYVDASPESDLVNFYLSGIVKMSTNVSLENVLTLLIAEHKHSKKILFVLDSDGGIGLLEFKTVVEGMGDEGFYVFMDDFNDHIKHIRSRWVVEENKDGRWKVLFKNDRVGIVERIGR